MASPADLLKGYSVAEVGDWLKKLELPDEVIAAFHDNSVAGGDLCTLTDEDFTKELKCTNLQARKIRRSLVSWGIGAAPAPYGSTPHMESAPSAPSAPPMMAPAPSAASSGPITPAASGPAAPPAAEPARDAGGDAARAAAAQHCAQLEGAIQGLEAQAAESARGVQMYGRGAQLLAGASKDLGEALQALGGMQAVQGFEMGRGIARRAMFGVPARHQHDLGANLVEMGTLRKANSEIQQAAHQVQEAATLLPGMPPVDARVLGSAKTGLLQNVLFGGTMSDAMQMAAVKKSADEVRGMLAQVQAAAQWAQQNANAHQQREAGARQELGARRAELDAIRRQAAGM